MNMKANDLKVGRVIPLVAEMVLAGSLHAAVPATLNAAPTSFSAGNVISAAAVNTNFSNLFANDGALNTEIGATNTLVAAANTQLAKVDSTNWSTVTGGIKYSGGKLGIGAATPTTLFQVDGSASGTAPLTAFNITSALANCYPLALLRPVMATDDRVMVALGQSVSTGNAGYMSMQYKGNNDDANSFGLGVVGVQEALYWNKGRQVGIAGAPVAGNGIMLTVYGKGSFSDTLYVNGTTYTSDKRLKKDIATIPSPLEAIARLRGVTYR
jgi:hypothetical protein